MKTLWILILITLTLLSCDFDDFEFYALEGESRGALCRHEAVMAALVYGEHYPVRIVRGAANTGYDLHAQAQAYINGEWCFLQTVPSQIHIVTGDKDSFYTISEHFTLDEFLDDIWPNR